MALIKNLDEFQAVIPLSVASTIDPLMSDIELAEEKFLIPEIGFAAYTELQTKYDANDLSADFELLLKKCQRTVAYYAWLMYIPKAQLNFSDAGIRIASTEHFKNAFNWQIDGLEDASRDAGDVTMELLLAYMESKKNVFTTWAASTAFTQLKERFVYSAEVFNNHVTLPILRRTYRKLRVELRNAEVWHVLPITGQGLYDQLHTQSTAGTLTNLNKKLMEFILYGCSNMALATGIAALTIDINDLGITNGTNSSYKQKIKVQATSEARLDAVKKFETDAFRHLLDLKQYLFTNHADYPLYEASTAYVVSPIINLDNALEKKYYAVR